MNLKTAHIALDGKPLCAKHDCLNHSYLMGGRTPGGLLIGCDYYTMAQAKAVAKYLRSRLPHNKIRVKGGPCPSSL